MRSKNGSEGTSVSKAIAKVKPVKIDPIKVGKFGLGPNGLLVHGKPTIEEYADVGAFIDYTLNASPWWKADWVAYGETRGDWQERLSQVIEATGLTEKTIKNLRTVAESVPPSRRRDTLPFSVHAEVASLTAKEQKEWLDRAEQDGLSVREVRTLIRARRRRRIIDGQAKLEGMYRVFLVDFPWDYDEALPSGSTVDDHYPPMSIEDGMKLPVEAHALPNAVMFMWATAPVLLQNPGPRDLGEAWGFEYKQNLVWDKVLGTYGHYCNGRHEHLLIWTRGSGTPDIDANWLDSVQTFRRTEHSAKPVEFYSIIEKLYPTGPYVELFAREKREGWSAFGNDARLWKE